MKNRVHKLRKIGRRYLQRPLSSTIRISTINFTQDSNNDAHSVSPRNDNSLKSNSENLQEQDNDDLDEEMIEEDDQEELDSNNEDEDLDETPGSRPFTPDVRPSNENSAHKKPTTHNSNSKLNSTSYRGAFTCKIVKKKAQDIDKGYVIAFGTTAAIKKETPEMSNQQILERNRQIQKHYHGPYKKK